MSPKDASSGVVAYVVVNPPTANTMHLRRLIAGAAALLASASTPMALQAQSAYPIESSWMITDATEYLVSITVRFRNTQGYDPTQIFGITYVGFSYNGPTNDNCSTLYCSWSSPILKTVGNVDKAPFTNHGRPVVFSLGTFSYSYAPNHEGTTFGPLDILRGPGEETWGVLGCQTVPDVVELFAWSEQFAGRTCASEGFDGWIEATSTFNTGGVVGTGIDGRLLSEADFSAGAGGEYRILPTPEPTTYAFMLTGLVAVGCARRRRNRAA